MIENTGPLNATGCRAGPTCFGEWGWTKANAAWGLREQSSTVLVLVTQEDVLGGTTEPQAGYPQMVQRSKALCPVLQLSSKCEILPGIFGLTYIFKL